MPKQDLPPVPTKKTPIFVGKSALVRLINGSDPTSATIWLVDSTNKTLRPFVGEEQFDLMFDNPEQAKKAVTTLSSDELGNGGLLGDFHVLGHDYGVHPDGSMKNVPFSPAQIQNRYGKPVDEGAENNAVANLDGLFGQLSPGTQPNMEEGDPNQGAPMPGSQSPMTPQPPMEGAGGPGSGTVYDGEKGLKMYDGQGGPDLVEYSTLDGHKLKGGESYVGSDGLTYTEGQPIPNGTSSTSPSYNPDTGLPSAGFTFGKTSNPTAESIAIGTRDATLNLAKQPTSGSSLTPEFIQKISQDPLLMSFYVSALAYGGYSMSDVYNDMYRIQQGENGDVSMQNLSLISPTQPKSVYIQSTEGAAAVAKGSTILPPSDGMRSPDSAISKYVAGIPESLFNEQNKPPEFGTPAWYAAIADVKTGYFDLLTQQASASTEQEKAAADYNMSQFNNQVSTYLGILLSNNSTQAWKQIQNLDQDAANRGIQGSGIENKSIDDTLKTARLNDTRNRANSLNQLEQEQAAVMKSSGSATQIANLTPEQRQAWGLTPSAEVSNKYSIASIKALDPSMTDAQAQAYRDKIIDENGNYRSTLYQNQYSNQYALNYHTPPANQSRQDYQQSVLEQNAINAKTAHDKEFSITNDPNSPSFLAKPASQTPTNPPITNTVVPTNTQTVKSPAVTPTATSSVTPPSTQPTKSIYGGPSIVDYLVSTGAASDINSRATLAKQNGIAYNPGATGTESATQNTALLKKLRGY